MLLLRAEEVSLDETIITDVKSMFGIDQGPFLLPIENISARERERGQIAIGWKSYCCKLCIRKKSTDIVFPLGLG